MSRRCQLNFLEVVHDAVNATVHVGVIGTVGGTATWSAVLAAFDRAANSVTGRVGAANSRLAVVANLTCKSGNGGVKNS